MAVRVPPAAQQHARGAFCCNNVATHAHPESQVAPQNVPRGREDILRTLAERRKELNAIHNTARMLQGDRRSYSDVFTDVVKILPAAWQYPEIASARICFAIGCLPQAAFLSLMGTRGMLCDDRR